MAVFFLNQKSMSANSPLSTRFNRLLVVDMQQLNNHRLKPEGLSYGLEVRIRVA